MDFNNLRSQVLVGLPREGSKCRCMITSALPVSETSRRLGVSQTGKLHRVLPVGLKAELSPLKGEDLGSLLSELVTIEISISTPYIAGPHRS